MSSAEKTWQPDSESATARAWPVSSVYRPALRPYFRESSISVTFREGGGSPSRGAPKASPIASPTRAPAARKKLDIKITQNQYLVLVKSMFEER
jgi:hypothetical protein